MPAENVLAEFGLFPPQTKSVNGWTVELTTSAQREFRQLEDGPQQAAAEPIADLAEDPSLVPSLEMRANPQIRRARFHQGQRVTLIG